MSATVTKRVYLCRPSHILEAIEARAGLKLATSTLKSWRRLKPLDLPCMWLHFDDWLDAVLKDKHDRRARARTRRRQKTK
jgi:hypothetical protein